MRNIIDKIGYENNEVKDIIGESVIMKNLKEQVQVAAHLPWPILILGETGAGKEVAARAIHNAGPRQDREFVFLNCGGMPDTLVESELFGYVKGAFTDAKKDKKGKFEEANGGTIFLDEIGNAPYKLQISLLRVLETGKIAPVGANREKPVDVRIICATNRTLEELKYHKKGIRNDLLNRIGALIITVPPLKDHKEDISDLTKNFIQEFNEQVSVFTGEKTLEISISENAIDRLKQWDFPEGNVRELRNILQRAIMLSGKANGAITAEDVEKAINFWEFGEVRIHSNRFRDLLEDDYTEYAKRVKGMKNAQKMRIMEIDEETLNEKERICYEKLLEENGTINHLAKRLKISRSELSKKLKKLGIVNRK
jgi:transcriptional regulator with GAF, ATPase, and Fis domain